MGAGRHPHLFQLIKVADLGAEDVNDHIAPVDQNPIAGFLAFHLGRHAELLAQTVCQLLGNRRNLTRRTARTNDQVIRHIRPTAQVNLNDVFGFVVIDRGQNGSQNMLWGIVRGGTWALGPRPDRQTGRRVRMSQDIVLQKARRKDTAPYLGQAYHSRRETSIGPERHPLGGSNALLRGLHDDHPAFA
jgi:hypothetical protein